MKDKRKRKSWFVGNVAQREAHDGRAPLTRDWREGEPQVYVRSVQRRFAKPDFGELYMATVYKRRAMERSES